MAVPYVYYLKKSDLDAAGKDIDDYRRRLKTFLKFLYYNNDAFFTLKLCFLRLAFAKIPTAKMLFEIGSGGDGIQIWRFVCLVGIDRQSVCSSAFGVQLMHVLKLVRSLAHSTMMQCMHVLMFVFPLAYSITISTRRSPRPPL
jgi:hypothetical protein